MYYVNSMIDGVKQVYVESTLRYETYIEMLLKALDLQDTTITVFTEPYHIICLLPFGIPR